MYTFKDAQRVHLRGDLLLDALSICLSLSEYRGDGGYGDEGFERGGELCDGLLSVCGRTVYVYKAPMGDLQRELARSRGTV